MCIRDSFNGFYQQMTAFIRSLFESALKTNPNLEFAVVTGCLRISKESIFTGLNNLKMVSLLDVGYSEQFGFTQAEVDRMLQYYDITGRREEVKAWYDGYKFGKTEVYNPWSILMYADKLRLDRDALPRPYSVSYTHLDVYKRQGRKKPRNALQWPPQVFRSR